MKWSSIPGFEGQYEASDAGQIRRIGRGRGVVPGRILKARRLPAGYLIYSLFSGNRQHVRLAHRLVASAFLGPCPEGHEVNHNNLKKTDNRLVNLEYLTRSENLLHRARAGIGRGQQNGAAKLTDLDVSQIRARYRQGGHPGYKALGIEYGVSWEAIRNIIKGRAWKWLAK